MRLIFPRVILGNRGDLASRWGILRALHELNIQDVTVFSHIPDDLPPLPYQRFPYGRIRNLLPSQQGWRALRQADMALWAVGLDLQDDSSLIKLPYLLILFRLYKLMGLKTICLFQGAGPLTTSLGRAIASLVLKSADCFIARDPGTYRLIAQLHPRGRRILAHDAIFLPGFEEDLASLNQQTHMWLDNICDTHGRRLVGLNLRQWFHFSSSLLPYQFAQKTFHHRSLAKMQELLAAAAELVQRLRREQQARVLLISAYQSGVVPWEDDLFWLRALKARFADDDEVQLIDQPFTLKAYFGLMARLQLMIGMRLHSTLIAMRFGVPSINVSYTLKGRDIMSHLGLGDQVLDLEAFLRSPDQLFTLSVAILNDLEQAQRKTREAVAQAIQLNREVLANLVNGSSGKA